MKNALPRVIIILPAFNEERGIRLILQRIDQHLQEAGLGYTSIVVNDGSTDQTAALVRACAKTMPVLLVEHPVNRGVGAAFFSGFTKAVEVAGPDDAIVVMEADNTSEVAILRQIVATLDSGFDIVCASRYVAGGGYLRFPLKRLIFSRGINFLLRRMFPMGRLCDYSIFYRGYRASLIAQALRLYGSSFIVHRGFVANVEVLVKLQRFSPRVSEVPLRYDYGNKKSSSKLNATKTILGYLRLFWEQKWRRRPLS